MGGNGSCRFPHQSDLYDHRNRLVQRTIDGQVAHFKYDQLGNLTGRDLANATDPPNQLYADATRPHAVTQRTDGVDYAYDADGNVVQRGTQHIEYDWRNLPTCIGVTPGTCDVAQYSYDVDGNRIAELRGGVLHVFVRDLFEFVGSESHAEAHIYAFGERIATQVSDNASLRAAWDPAAWPLPVDPETLGWALGLLGATGLAWWLARAGALVAIRARPVRSGLAIALSVAIAAPAYAGGGGDNDWVRRWYHNDHLGSAILVTNEMGDVIHRRVFEPFGKVIAQTSPATEETTTLYAGKEWNSSSDLVDFGARQYDPEAARFLSIDPVVQRLSDPQTINPYTYVRNNPVAFTDPDGMFWIPAGWWDPESGFGIEPADWGWLYEQADLKNGLDQFSQSLHNIFDTVEILQDAARSIQSIGDFGETEPLLTGEAAGFHAPDETESQSGDPTLAAGALIAAAEAGPVGALILGTGYLIYDIYTGGPVSQAGVFMGESLIRGIQVLQQSDETQKKVPKPGVGGKEGAKDVPSWAEGERPNVGESGKDFADRLLGAKYGPGNYPKGPGSEHSKIQKWGDRAFQDP